MFSGNFAYSLGEKRGNLLLPSLSPGCSTSSSLSLSSDPVFTCPLSVVGQSYAAEVGNQHVMDGNAALLSCQLPSFVADLVRVVGWVDEQGNQYQSGPVSYGNWRFSVGLFLCFRNP
jgi:hypothetical protein